MRMRRFYWLILGIMGGVLASVAIGQQLRRACSSFTALEPVIEYPSRLDLGKHEIGEVVVAPFTIANRGRRELVVTQILGPSGKTEPVLSV